MQVEQLFSIYTMEKPSFSIQKWTEKFYQMW